MTAFITNSDADLYLNLRYADWATIANDEKARLLIRATDHIRAEYLIPDALDTDTETALGLACAELAYAANTVALTVSPDVSNIKQEQVQLGTMSKSTTYRESVQDFRSRFPLVASMLSMASIERREAVSLGVNTIGVRFI